jgi:hypothetical protein
MKKKKKNKEYKKPKLTKHGKIEVDLAPARSIYNP